jgi:hypothetical protein
VYCLHRNIICSIQDTCTQQDFTSIYLSIQSGTGVTRDDTMIHFKSLLARSTSKGSKSKVAINTCLPQASHPCGNFSGTSGLAFRISGLRQCLILWCYLRIYCAHSIIFHDQTNAHRLPTQTTNKLLMLKNSIQKANRDSSRNPFEPIIAAFHGQHSTTSNSPKAFPTSSFSHSTLTTSIV